MNMYYTKLAFGIFGITSVQVVSQVDISTQETVETIVRIVVQIIIGFATLISLYRNRKNNQN